MLARLAPFILAFALAACASAPTYQPAGTAGGPGYSETQVEANRYFVTYRAKGRADASLLQDMALLRAADLTLMQNQDWFIVDRRSTDAGAGRGGGPSVGVSVGGGSWGGNSGVGVGVGMSLPIGRGGGERASAATVEIRTGSGPKPDDPNAYDARSVAASLRSRIAAR